MGTITRNHFYQPPRTAREKTWSGSPVKPPKPQRSDNVHGDWSVEVLFTQGHESVVLVIPGIACIQGGNLAPIFINTCYISFLLGQIQIRRRGGYTYDDGPIKGLNG